MRRRTLVAAAVACALVGAGTAVVAGTASPERLWSRDGERRRRMYDGRAGDVLEDHRVASHGDGRILLVVAEAPRSWARRLLRRVTGDVPYEYLAVAVADAPADADGWRPYVVHTATQPEGAAADPSLAGRWEFTGPPPDVCLPAVLGADGTYVLGPMGGRWCRAGDVLLFEDGDQDGRLTGGAVVLDGGSRIVTGGGRTGRRVGAASPQRLGPGLPGR